MQCVRLILSGSACLTAGKVSDQLITTTVASTTRSTSLLIAVRSAQCVQYADEILAKDLS